MKRLIPFCFLLLVYAAANAQGEFTLYNLNRSVPQAHQLNPSFRPNAKVMVGFPALSSTRVSVDLGQLSFNTVFSKISEQSFALDAESISSQLRDKNNFSIQSDLQLFFLGLNLGNNFFSFAINDRISSWMVYNKDIADLALFGNGHEKTFGKNLSLDHMLLRQNLYHEFAFGFATQIGQKLNIGVRAKLLSGVINSQTDEISGYLRTDQDSIHFTNSSFSYRNSGFNYFEGDLDILSMYRNTLPFVGGNSGFALDVGANYQVMDRLNVSASLTDMGYINWKDNTESYNFDNVTYSFRGFDVLDLLSSDGENNDFLQNELDSLENLFTPNELENIVYKSSLVTNFYTGVDYQLGKNHHVGAQVFGRMAEGQITPEFAAYYNIQVGQVVNAVVNASFRNGKIHAAGIGASVDLGPIQIYGTTESVTSLINPQKASLIDARVGINLIFGKKKKDIMLAENEEQEEEIPIEKEDVPEQITAKSVPSNSMTESTMNSVAIAAVAIPSFANRPEIPVEEEIVEEVIPEPEIVAPPVEEPKVVVVQQGDHQDELPLGHYVVVGAFLSKANAQRYSANLQNQGFENQFGFLTEKDFYYVTVHKNIGDIEEARKIRNNYRQRDEFLFPDSWLLSVVE